jgi:hypothetical protein
MSDTYQPGDKVKKSGIYAVLHDGTHEEKHEVTCVAGKTFPPCHGCGADVDSRSSAQPTTSPGIRTSSDPTPRERIAFAVGCEPVGRNALLDYLQEVFGEKGLPPFLMRWCRDCWS